MEGRERLDDVHPYLRWFIVFIKEVGFPIAVAVYMGYIAITSIPRMTNSLESNTRTMEALAESVKNQNRISERSFRMILKGDYPE